MVVIVEGQRPICIVTDRDLVTRALARRMAPDARVDGVMSSGVVCVDSEAELSARGCSSRCTRSASAGR